MNIKIFCYLVNVLIICTLLGSCLDTNNKSETKSKEIEMKNTNDRDTFVYNKINYDLNASITKEYAEAVNNFSINLLFTLYQTSNYHNKNIILSPISISRNLALLTEGAEGDSKEKLLTLLGGQSALDDAMSALSKLLYTDESVILHIADALWYDSNKFSLKEEFKNIASTKYGIKVSDLNFDNPENTIKTVNSWIYKNTNEYIEKMLDTETIWGDEVCFITSASYFEAAWSSPFEIHLTREELFHSPNGDFKVEMMSSSNYTFQIYPSEKYINSKIYYGTNEKDFFYLDIFMPEGITIDTFLESECHEALIESKASDISGRIQIPKFTLETDVNIKEVLLDMGVTCIFENTNGDFSQIFKDDSLETNFYLSKIYQSSGIKTDEEGTVAFSATVTNAAAKSDAYIDVIFNKPFIYFIRAGENGLILFAGVINNPAES